MSSSVLSKVARPYNIVLWGATGFTGRLACMHVVQQADPSLRVALAGRDRNKLEALREELKRHAASQVFHLDKISMDKFGLKYYMFTIWCEGTLATPVVFTSVLELPQKYDILFCA